MLINYLNDAHAPTTIHSILARRHDVSFLRHLLRHVAGDLTTNMRLNLRRIASFVWLRDDLSVLAALNDEEQGGVIQLAMASAMNRLEVFEVVKYVLKNGGPVGRRSALAALGITPCSPSSMGWKWPKPR